MKIRVNNQNQMGFRREKTFKKCVLIISFLLLSGNIKSQEAIDNYIFSAVLHPYIQAFDSANLVKHKNIYFADSTIYSAYNVKKNPIDASLPDSIFYSMMSKYRHTNYFRKAVIPEVANLTDKKISVKIIKTKTLEQLASPEGNLIKPLGSFGVILFSIPVFSDDSVFCFVYRSILNGASGSRGDIFFLSNINGKWAIIYEEPLWIQ